MKKSIILILTVLIPVLGIAQSNKLVTEKVDDMTMAKIFETKYIDLNRIKLFDNGANFMMKFRKIDNRIIIDLYTSNQQIFSIIKDDELMLKLSNDSILKFKNNEYSIAHTFNAAGATLYILENSYYANIEDIEMLSKFQLKKIRVYLSDSYLEREIKPDMASKLQELSKAFYEKIK